MEFVSSEKKIVQRHRTTANALFGTNDRNQITPGDKSAGDLTAHEPRGKKTTRDFDISSGALNSLNLLDSPCGPFSDGRVCSSGKDGRHGEEKPARGARGFYVGSAEHREGIPLNTEHFLILRDSHRLNVTEV